ncbi:hypothetical protein PCANC_14245 [Puccinia coronata f. sp. avenae]|uniref:Uncharacterized protein n=1 Tax=Puccinia coronata f. sp. avenae TaxID=200324 RepID=A0A2N5SIV9_9BASI|nr:hypothetical protein PCANC_18634 [Puccinia coronata f. sp. avenae]PLW39913.1 hypothetical protein PCANC_14245 [Puccinia coronata f. sp. avenae]
MTHSGVINVQFYLLPGLILTPTSDKLTQLDIILALQISRLKKKRDPTYPYAFDRVSPSFTILIRHILLLRAITWITSNAQRKDQYLDHLFPSPLSGWIDSSRRKHDRPVSLSSSSNRLHT